MKCFTGDESGLVKEITLPKTTIAIPTASTSTSSQNETIPPISTWGEAKRDLGIQMMCHAKIFGEQKQIVVARRNGLIQILDPYNGGKVCKEFTNERVAADKKKTKNTTFVGLYANDNILVTCTSTGNIRYQPIGGKNDSTIDKNITYETDLCRLRVHPKENNIFACGGKQRDLTLWDINAKEEPIFTKRKGWWENGMIWMAKNIRCDLLTVHSPVWVTDIQFLSEEEKSKIVIGTRYHQIRIYDIKAQRRPVFETSIGHKSVVSLILGRDPNHIIFSDTVGNVFTVDIRNGKNIGQYKGFNKGTAGSVTGLSIDDKSSSLVSVSLDRFLRVHKMNQERELVHSVYLKQKLTGLIVDDAEETQSEKHRTRSESDTDDEDWNQIKPQAKKRKTI